MKYSQGYFPQREPQSSEQHGSTVAKVALVILSAVVLIVLIAFPEYRRGTVIEKQGQLPPIVSEYLLDYGWEVVDNPQSPDPNGWYVLLQNGNTYTNHRLTAKQFEQIQLGATLVCIGPFVWWANP